MLTEPGVLRIGETVRIDVTWLLLDVPTDPTGFLVLLVKPPGAPRVSYTYGVDPHITKTGIGKYSAFFTLVGSEGTWWYRWTATHTDLSAVPVASEGIEEKSFNVTKGVLG